MRVESCELQATGGAESAEGLGFEEAFGLEERFSGSEGATSPFKSTTVGVSRVMAMLLTSSAVCRITMIHIVRCIVIPGVLCREVGANCQKMFGFLRLHSCYLYSVGREIVSTSTRRVARRKRRWGCTWLTQQLSEKSAQSHV